MQTPPQQTNVTVKKKRAPLVTGLFVLIGACFVLGIIGAIANPNKSTTGSSGGVVQVQATNTVAIVNGAATNPTSAPVVAQATAVPPTAIPPTDVPKAAALTVGSTGETNGLKVTLNSVRHETSGLVAPKSDAEYLIVNVTFENTSNDKKTVSSLANFSVKDDTGQQYHTAFGANTKSSADGSVAVGDKLRGETAFEVPKSATNLTFIYDPVFGGDPLRFKLDR